MYNIFVIILLYKVKRYFLKAKLLNANCCTLKHLKTVFCVVETHCNG